VGENWKSTSKLHSIDEICCCGFYSYNCIIIWNFKSNCFQNYERVHICCVDDDNVFHKMVG
jgi:hypothetical protein